MLESECGKPFDWKITHVQIQLKKSLFCFAFVFVIFFLQIGNATPH